MISAAQVQVVLNGNPAFQFVGGGGDYVSAAEQLRVTRSVFVLPPIEKAQPNSTGTQVLRQRSTVQVTVILGFIVRTASKADQSGDVDTTREALKAALIGWTPDPSTHEPMNFVGSQPLAVNAAEATVFYACNFTMVYYLRAIPK